jgi:hypothetical protein
MILNYMSKVSDATHLFTLLPIIAVEAGKEGWEDYGILVGNERGFISDSF